MEQRVIFVIALLAIGANADIPDSDLELGFTDPRNILISHQNHFVEPIPGFKPPEKNVVMGNQWIWMTLVTAKESGQYPDARVSVVSGGPGYNEVVLKITPGPSGGYNYTFESWGVRFVKFRGFVKEQLVDLN